MADNVATNPGTGGDTIAADDISGVKYQRVKLVQGADGTNDGDISSAAPLQVTLANTGANTSKILVTPDLPTGASTAAKQPALGTAGTASADVITVQGKAAMTPILTDGSATTQPVSSATFATSAKQDTGNTSLSSIDGKITAVNTGAVVVSSGSITANAGTNLNTSTLATETTLAGTIKAEDAAHSSGDKGIMHLAVRNDTRSALAGTDGDYIPLTTNSLGDTRTEIASLAGTVVDTNSGTKSAGTMRVVLATDQPALTNKLLVTPDSVALPANQSVNEAQINGVTPLMGAGNTGTGSQRVTIATDDVNLAIISGAVKTEDAASGNANTGIPSMAIRDDTLNSTSGTEGDWEFLHTTADGALWVTQAPSTSNGWLTFMASSGDGSTALTSTAQAVKASAGTLGGWYIYNPNATATYVIIYNTAQGSVTVGTTNPQMVLCIPATSAANQEFGNGINFTTAISVAATTTGGGNTAPSTALEVNLFYK